MDDQKKVLKFYTEKLEKKGSKVFLHLNAISISVLKVILRSFFNPDAFLGKKGGE